MYSPYKRKKREAEEDPSPSKWPLLPSRFRRKQMALGLRTPTRSPEPKLQTRLPDNPQITTRPSSPIVIPDTPPPGEIYESPDRRSPTDVTIVSSSDEEMTQSQQAPTATPTPTPTPTPTIEPIARPATLRSRVGPMRLWDAAINPPITVFEQGHFSSIWCVALSPDGARVASGSWDKTVRVWDTATGTQISVFEGHVLPVTFVAFSADGTRIISRDGLRNELQFDCPSNEAASSPSSTLPGIVTSSHMGSGWLFCTVRGKQFKMWIPEDRRPLADAIDAVACCHHLVAIGTRSGKVVVLDFSGVYL